MRLGVLFAVASFSGTAALSQELPPVSEDLLDAFAIVCVKISNAGVVVGAFMVQSTGDPKKDRHLLAWVRQALHWPKGEPEEKLRNTWFPMPIAFGDAQVPAMPAPRRCK